MLVLASWMGKPVGHVPKLGVSRSGLAARKRIASDVSYGVDEGVGEA